ncbi:hypothetical protein HMPREF9078_01842, partial [Capnocytophaga sp. oral taxon 380 str. F0488]
PKGDKLEKGDKPPSYHILRSRGVHTQLLLATSEREKVVTEKGRNDEGRLTKGI